MQFEWDDQKNRHNKANHGISFELACEVWLDHNRLLVMDPASMARKDGTPLAR